MKKVITYGTYDLLHVGPVSYTHLNHLFAVISFAVLSIELLPYRCV